MLTAYFGRGSHVILVPVTQVGDVASCGLLWPSIYVNDVLVLGLLVTLFVVVVTFLRTSHLSSEHAY